jgi:hypothetical protein
MSAGRNPRVYGVCLETQGPLISAFCHGRGCGKGHMGFTLTMMGTLITCDEAHCPHSETEQDMGELGADHLILRSLRKK